MKTASESILEETVVPSEEANYSQQGYAGKGVDSIFRIILRAREERQRKRERESERVRGIGEAVGGRNPMERKTSAPRSIRCRDQGRPAIRLLLHSVSDRLRRRNSYCSRRRSFKGDVASRPLLTGVWRYRYTARGAPVHQHRRGNPTFAVRPQIVER